MSGYDIKRFLQRLSWLVDSPSFGSLYPALHALLEDDLVTVEVIPRQDKPPRKIYTIAETGEQTLQKWVSQPAASSVSLKTFLMHLILASSLSHDGLIDHLEQRRTQVADHQCALQQTAESVNGKMDLGDLLALDYGLTMAAAELSWLDRMRGHLSQSSLSAETVQDDLAAVINQNRASLAQDAREND
ncbi:MAG: PadR family transcriptional regulator [Chloroflexi bacterium]|nr:PadR family transcriptional regulator [Chloroflexota bacterium]